MPNDLDLLIDYYQWEIQRVLTSIDENKQDHDFMAVHLNYQSLGTMQRELDHLLELKNPLYPEIQRLERQIEDYQRLGNIRDKPFFKEYFRADLERAKSSLNALKNMKTKKPKEETQFLDEAIFSLMQNEVHSFKIHFDKTGHTFLHVSKVGGEQITILLKTADKKVVKWLREYTVISGLGFALNEESGSLQTSFRMHNPKNILPLKEFLSKIVIGTKGYLEAKNTVFLEYIP